MKHLSSEEELRDFLAEIDTPLPGVERIMARSTAGAQRVAEQEMALFMAASGDGLG